MESGFLIALAFGLALALVLVPLDRRLHPQPPRIAGRYSGEAAPNRSLVLALAFGCAGVAATAFLATFVNGFGLATAASGAAAAVIALAAATALHPGYAVAWNSEGIEGPVTLWPAPGGPDRASFDWDSITSAGGDQAGNRWARHWDGTVIRWNAAWPGAGGLAAAIARNCPHLATGRVPRAGIVQGS